jgi:glycine oxidase
MYDVIVVGQGIAGSILSYFLEKKEKNYLVIDFQDPTSASRVAAGLFNPVSFKRLNPVLDAALYFNNIARFYRELENYCKATFYYETPILKHFNSEFEENQWIYKADAFPDFFSTEKVSGYERFGKVKQSGHINTQHFLSTYRNVLEKKERVLNEHFDYETLKHYDDYLTIEVSGRIISAKKIVFCEGYQIKNNPFFQHIELWPTKGEILKIKTDQDIDLPYVLHQNGFVVPIDKNHFFAGTTYDKEHIDTVPTEAAEKSIRQVFEQLLPGVSYRVVEHRVGVRPNARERQPFLIQHFVHSNLYALNGLGSRGLSVAPIFIESILKRLEEV